MKEIILGSTNPGKIAHIQAALDPLGIKVVGLNNFDNLPQIEENGQTAAENARIKAVTYSRFLQQPVLSTDNALYIDGLEDEEQPGIYVRRIPGFDHRPSDEEMIEYYSGKIDQYGGEMNGHWNFALCLAFPDGKMTEAVAISQPRLFTSKVSLNRSPGYPLESLQIDPKTGKYVVEMTEEEVGQFWLESTGEKIRELFAGLEEIKTDTAE